MRKLIIACLTMSVIITLYSCNENQELNTNPDAASKAALEAQNHQIGQKHNELADIVIANWSIESDDSESVAKEINRILRTETAEFCAKYDMSPKAFSNLVSDDVSYETIKDDILSPRYWVGQGASSVLAEKMVLFAEAFWDADGTEVVEDLQIAMISHRDENIGELKGQDAVIYQMAVDVAINSVLFWYPVEQGGMGRAEQFRNGETSGRAEAWPGWGAIFLADTVGIATGAIGSVTATGGASALPNPLLGGVPTASAVGLVTGVGASIGKAI